MEHIITAYIIPTIAIVMSVIFWFSGRESARKAEELLDEVTKTTKGWQSDIMKSAYQMLNSRPELAAHQMYMAKIEAAAKISDSIQTLANDIVKNPKDGEGSKIQVDSLKMLLDYQIHYFKFIVDGKDLPLKVSTELENKIKSKIPQFNEEENSGKEQ